MKQLIPDHYKQLLKKEHENPMHVQNLQVLIKTITNPNTDALEMYYSDLIYLYSDLKHMSYDMLYYSNIFFGLWPFLGLYMSKNFTYRFENSLWKLLYKQLHEHLKRIWYEDISLDFDVIETLNEPNLNRICLDRAIEINDTPREEKIKDLKIWTFLSNEKDFTDT